jgi:glycine/D-amino acid oxidase-like deaminating enzyme
MSCSFEGMYEPGIVDPGLPVDNSTTPFWHSDPHHLANHQSPWPIEPVDVAVIGSGMTGAALAHAILSKRPRTRVVLLDARSLCSGATARNGGHIKTMSYAAWDDRKRTLGVEEATRLTAFEHSHLQSMTDTIRKSGIDCDLVETEGVDAYYNQEAFESAIAALDSMRADVLHMANQYQVCADTQRLQRDMKLSSRCVGAIVVPAASIWPYKMVMGLLHKLIERDTLNVQPHTPVLSIDEKAANEFAVVKTSRGEFRARHVVHATNGWLGHLLPELRPFISPVRGNVVHYDPAGKLSPMGLDSRYSFWMRYAAKDYDYLIQRISGDIVVGRANTGRKTTGDDSQTDSLPIAQLRGMAAEVAASPAPDARRHITHAWSGILGFTQDTMPFVGRLPFPNRHHQWVCGGYHGVGMVKAFRAAQMASLLILDEPLGDEYPRSMMITERRIEELKSSLGDSGGEQRAKL